MRMVPSKFGVGEAVVVTLVGLIAVWFNFSYLAHMVEASPPDGIRAIVVFYNCLFLMLMFLPAIMKLLGKYSNEQVERFLDFPDRDTPFTFQCVSSFVSDQALGAFLATVLVHKGRQALDGFGPEVAAAFAFFMLMVTLVFMLVSTARFVQHLTKFHWAVYAVGALISVGFTFLFLQIGIELAS